MIVTANLSSSFEEYLEIVDRYDADDLVLRSEATRTPVRGKDALPFLAFSLTPLHVLAEIGGLRMVVSVQPMVGDNLNETPAAWTVDLVGLAKRLHWLAQGPKSWLGR